MPRQGDYLYKRKGSQNWWLRLQSFDGKPIKEEKSMGTPDRALAQVRSADRIKQHKFDLLTKRAWSAPNLSLEPEWRPGSHTLDDGTKVFATATEIHFLDDAGQIVRTERNRVSMLKTVFRDEDQPLIRKLQNPRRATDDDSIIETWITHQGVGKHLASEARNVWDLFKEIAGNKPLSRCSREDEARQGAPSNGK